jgi:hypothetical protein
MSQHKAKQGELRTLMPARQPTGGPIALGVLERVESPVKAVVSIEGRSLAAQTLVPLKTKQVGASVALWLGAGGDGGCLILGVVLERAPRPVLARLDGRRVSLRADRELVLRCGPASLTLTRDGKVVLRGAEVLQTATGTHRIHGAAVRIN